MNAMKEGEACGFASKYRYIAYMVCGERFSFYKTRSVHILPFLF